MIAWLTTWWVWIALALLLGIVEVLAPGFIFLGFALGALVLGLGLAALPGAIAGLSIQAILALYAGLSLLAWLALRFVFRRQSSGAQSFEDDIND